MAGTKSNAYPVRDVLRGYSSAAISNNLRLIEAIITFPCRIGAVKVYSEVAGDRTTSAYIVDVLKNGTSVYGATADKPTIAFATTGEWTNVAPATRALQPGDRISVQVIQVATGGTTDASRVHAAVTLELA